MFKTAVRNVFAHKARLLMTVLAVMLGVAFVSGTLVFTSTISDAFQHSSEKGFSGVDVSVKPSYSASAQGPSDAAPKLSQDLLDRVGKVPGAASATGSVSGFTAIADKHGKLIGDGFSSTGRNYYPGRDGTDARYPLVHGSAPHGAGEIALDTKTAARAGYHVGDRVRISVKGPVRTERISGVFRTDDGTVTAGGSLALFDTTTAQKLFSSPGAYQGIDVKAAPGTSQAALKAQVEKILPKGQAEATTGEKLAHDQAESIAKGMSSMRTGLLVFAGIALFVGVFIIANTFTMLISQRTKELALLRAVGAGRRQVTRSVLIEAVLVGAVASVVGLTAGVGIGAALRALIGSFGGGGSVPDGPLVVDPSTVVVSFLVGIGVTVLAAWLPARRAAKIPPVAAMNSVHATATTRSLVLRNTIGTLLAAGGAALIVAAAGMGTGGKLPMGGGAVLLLLGVFVLTPLLSRPLIAAVGPLLRIFGVSGKLARQNAVRNPRRTATTASALMIGLTLITGLTVIAVSMQDAISQMASKSLRADYVISMVNHGPLDARVTSKLAADPKVTAVSPLRDSLARVAEPGAGHRKPTPTSLTGVNGRDIGKLTNLDFTHGSLTAVEHTPAPTAGQRSARGSGPASAPVVVDSATAKEHGWKVGSVLPTTFEDGRTGRLTVRGVFEGNQMISGVIVDKSVLGAQPKDPADMQVLVATKGGTSAAAKDSLRRTLGDNPVISVQDKQDVSQSISQTINLMLNMLYGLLAMAVIVAVLGVVNTLAMSVFERSQEIGMLRAIGLDRRGTRRMVRLESLVISLFGGVLGVGLGVFFGWAAGQLIGGSVDTYTMVLPWGRMVLFLVLAALVGVLAALWPARRATRLNMLAAIKAE